MMTKHEVVMRYWGITAFYAAAFIPDTAGVAGGFEMDRDHWEDMGKPEVITVTVTPGGIGDADDDCKTEGCRRCRGKGFVPLEEPVYRRAVITHYGPAKDAVETQIELGWWVEIEGDDEPR